MRRTWACERRSVLGAPAETVWQRVVTPAGINDEMRPWLTMSIPHGADDLSIDTLAVGEPVGKAWLRIFGIVPFDYDQLTIAELEVGRRFREESTMLSMRRWTHERTVDAHPGGGCTVTDRVTLAPRLGLLWCGPLLATVVRALFAHRHRRLARRFPPPAPAAPQ